MSLELELWAMNSARISALEAGGGGGGSTSDLCVKVPKYDINYAAEHSDEVIEIEMEEETYDGWKAEFTVPDDGKPHYALIASYIGYGGLPAIVTLIQSFGGQLLDGDTVELVNTDDISVGNPDSFYSSIWSRHQTLLYDPEKEDLESKAYSIAYDDSAYMNPILLKNGATYSIKYTKQFSINVDDPELQEALDDLHDFLAMSVAIIIQPGTYEEIPVVVRNGGNT